MLNELAHYTLIFAVTAMGLQAGVLAWTLWTNAGAVAIRLGVQGACFTAGLLTFAFAVLMRGYAAHDFSLAVVFETFDSQSGALYALPAFLSSREGFFFTFATVLAWAVVWGYSKRDLATYRERGAYLFAGACLVFFLTAVMLATADPFARIEEPPFEGVGFNPAWRPPHKTLEFLMLFAAYAVFAVSFVKTVCLSAKPDRFVAPVLRNVLTALACVAAAVGSRALTGFTTAENGALWQWTPENSLLIAVLMLAAGQAIALYFCRFSHVFTRWVVVFSFCGLTFLTAAFFAAEYKLFAMTADEVYFPNPVTALCATACVVSFLMFLCTVLMKKTAPENDFHILSRESFAGLAIAVLLAAGIGVGGLSLLPTLFMFMPDLPLRLLPALFDRVLSVSVALVAVLFFVAFKRRSLVKGWAKADFKSDALFWGIVVCGAAWLSAGVDNGGRIAVCALPAVLSANVLLTFYPLYFPTGFGDLARALRRMPAQAIGAALIAAGLVVFSVSYTDARLNAIVTDDAFVQTDWSGAVVPPCRVETLSGKAAATPVYRFDCSAAEDGAKVLSGKTVFQGKNGRLDIKLINAKTADVLFRHVRQTREDEIAVRAYLYPSLGHAGTGLFLVCAGLLWLAFSMKMDV